MRTMRTVKNLDGKGMFRSIMNDGTGQMYYGYGTTQEQSEADARHQCDLAEPIADVTALGCKLDNPLDELAQANLQLKIADDKKQKYQSFTASVDLDLPHLFNSEI